MTNTFQTHLHQTAQAASLLKREVAVVLSHGDTGIVFLGGFLVPEGVVALRSAICKEILEVEVVADRLALKTAPNGNPVHRR